MDAAALDQLWNELKVNYSFSAALAFSVWEVIVAFDEEVAWVWSKSHVSFTKWLYVLCRYFPVVFLASLEWNGYHATSVASCRRWTIWQTFGLQLQLAVVDIILMLRVYALYERSRMVAIFLVGLWLVVNAIMAVSLGVTVPRMHFTPTCISLDSPPSVILAGAAAFVSSTLLFGLTAWKFIVAARAGWGRTPILALVVRDGTWTFVLTFLAIAVNSAFYLFFTDALSAVAFPWALAFPSFAACRLVLNLHALAAPAATHPHQPRRGGGGRGGGEETNFTTTRMEFTTRFASAADQGNGSTWYDQIEMTSPGPRRETEGAEGAGEGAPEGGERAEVGRQIVTAEERRAMV